MPRKKSGDLQSPIAVRLDKHVDEIVREIAAHSGTANEPSAVVRVLVSAYVMQQVDPISAFDEIATAVNRWRKSYDGGAAGGSAKSGGHDGDQAKQRPRQRRKE